MIFFNALENEDGKTILKTVSNCDNGGTVVGGSGGTYNPDLIDLNNSVAWNGLDQTGYGRALGAWNDYGGTGGYDLDVRVRNNSTGYTEISTVSSITSGSVIISTGESSFTVTVYESTTWMVISTETTGSSGGSTGGGCSSITITKGFDGGYTIKVGNCLPAQKSSQPGTKAASGCPVDDGEVGVVSSMDVLYIIKTLRISLLPNEVVWLEEVATLIQIEELKEYLATNNTAEGKAFGLEAIRAWMAGGEVDFVEQIINNLEGKALCVYNKLKSNSAGFRNVIRDFEPEFPVAHIKFTEKDLPNNVRGRAFPPNNYIIEIALNNNSSASGINYRPNLLTAKTIIHEVIHAEMFRKLLSLASSNGNIDTSLLTQMLEQGDYPGMLDYYTRYGLNSFQHQQMAQHYRQTIAKALQEYDTGFEVPSDQQPQQIYLDLAWEGLNHSSIIAWQQALTQTERDRIDLSITNYIAQYKNDTCQ